MRRAFSSILLNIAEGYESRTQLLFKDYPGRENASAAELHAQVYLAKDTGTLNDTAFTQLFDLCDKCSCQISPFMQNPDKQPKSIHDEGIDTIVERENV